MESWIGNQPVLVLTDHKSLISCAKEVLSTPSGPLGRRSRWHQIFSRFDLNVGYIPGKQNLIPDILSRWAYPASQAFRDICKHGTQEDKEEMEAIIKQEREEERQCMWIKLRNPPNTTNKWIRGITAQNDNTQTSEEGSGLQEVQTPVHNQSPPLKDRTVTFHLTEEQYNKIFPTENWRGTPPASPCVKQPVVSQFTENNIQYDNTQENTNLSVSSTQPEDTSSTRVPPGPWCSVPPIQNRLEATEAPDQARPDGQAPPELNANVESDDDEIQEMQPEPPLFKFIDKQEYPSQLWEMNWDIEYKK